VGIAYSGEAPSKVGVTFLLGSAGVAGASAPEVEQAASGVEQELLEFTP
jgi:hypothetical protein